MLFAFSLLCLGCVCAMGALLICAKCGHENDQGSRFCSHCGAGFSESAGPGPGPGVNPPAVAQANPDTAAAPVSAAVVEGDLKAAAEQLDKRNGWMALFYCENAMALNSVAKTPKDLADRVLKLHERCTAGVRSSVKECSLCNGTGSITRQNTSMSIEARKRNQTPINEICTSCRGTGIVPGRSGLDALKHGYDGALKTYGVLREAAKWVPIGNAWVPADLEVKLSYRQIVTLKRITGSRCSGCAGSGQITCAKCAGAGRLKCPSRTCASGYVAKKLDSGLDSSGRTLMVRCSVCDGRTSIKCSECDGYGSEPCKTCRGRGKLATCQRCDGDGLKRCSDCNGTGTFKKAVCVGCRGCGSILCRSCMGSGRVRESD